LTFLARHQYKLLKNSLSMDDTDLHLFVKKSLISCRIFSWFIDWRKRFGWLGKAIIQVWSFSSFLVFPSGFPCLQGGVLPCFVEILVGLN